ncbi:MAG: hypothetical protein SNJ71_00600 [Bacteroidales bacterium]
MSNYLAIGGYINYCFEVYYWDNNGWGDTREPLPYNFIGYGYSFTTDDKNKFIGVIFSSGPYAAIFHNYGTKIADPIIPIYDICNDITFHPIENIVVLATYYYPYLIAYSFSSNGFGTKISDPIQIPSGWLGKVKFSPNGNFLSTSCWGDNSPIITYSWENSNFGFKYASPLTIDYVYGNETFFNKDSDILGVSLYNYPYISVYNWSNLGYGTKYTSPNSTIYGNCLASCFSEKNNTIFLSGENYACIHAYEFNKNYGFGIKYADPIDAEYGDSRDNDFNEDTNTIAFIYNSSTIKAYNWSSGGFGFSYTNLERSSEEIIRSLHFFSDPPKYEIDLYISGSDYANNQTNLYCSGNLKLSQTSNLFIQGKNNTYQSINLYCGGKEKKENHISLFTSGQNLLKNNNDNLNKIGVYWIGVIGKTYFRGFKL